MTRTYGDVIFGDEYREKVWIKIVDNMNIQFFRSDRKVHQTHSQKIMATIPMPVVSLAFIVILPLQFECLDVQCQALPLPVVLCFVYVNPINNAFLPPLPDGTKLSSDIICYMLTKLVKFKV